MLLPGGSDSELRVAVIWDGELRSTARAHFHAQFYLARARRRRYHAPGRHHVWSVVLGYGLPVGYGVAPVLVHAQVGLAFRLERGQYGSRYADRGAA